MKKTIVISFRNHFHDQVYSPNYCSDHLFKNKVTKIVLIKNVYFPLLRHFKYLIFRSAVYLLHSIQNGCLLNSLYVLFLSQSFKKQDAIHTFEWGHLIKILVYVTTGSCLSNWAAAKEIVLWKDFTKPVLVNRLD